MHFDPNHSNYKDNLDYVKERNAWQEGTNNFHLLGEMMGSPLIKGYEKKHADAPFKAPEPVPGVVSEHPKASMKRITLKALFLYLLFIGVYFGVLAYAQDVENMVLLAGFSAGGLGLVLFGALGASVKLLSGVLGILYAISQGVFLASLTLIFEVLGIGVVVYGAVIVGLASYLMMLTLTAINGLSQEKRKLNNYLGTLFFVVYLGLFIVSAYYFELLVLWHGVVWLYIVFGIALGFLIHFIAVNTERDVVMMKRIFEKFVPKKDERYFAFSQILGFLFIYLSMLVAVVFLSSSHRHRGRMYRAFRR